MITDCPDCNRQFRIYARQLSAAKGLVQCGYCGVQFNALERLHDHPVMVSAPAEPAVVREVDLQGEPDFDIPGLAESGRADSSPSANRTGSGGERPVSCSGEAGAETDPDQMGVLEETVHRTSTLSRVLWASGVLMLLIAASAQVLWFNRDPLLTRHPGLIPLARELCERLHCDLIRVRDTSFIALLNRDVRDHPRFDDALLVNVTIENQAEILQPFPDIQMILFDPNGKVSGYRRFKPQEYLDQAVDRAGGMPPSVPVHLVLEVTGAGEGAVSFEFRFL